MVRYFRAATLLRTGARLLVRAALLTLGVARAVLAAEDVGVVLHVSGEVIFTAQGQHPARVRPYMRLREGDQMALPAGAGMKLVLFEGGRVEAWSGPAGFTLAPAASIGVTGSPVVSRIPVLGSGAPQLEKIGRFSRAGGIVLRSTAASPARVAASATDAMTRAKAQYEEWVAQAAPDDILPDLYLLAVLQEHRATEEVFALLAVMEKKQPGNADLQELSRFLRGSP